jgi:hypothetical protein
LPHFPWRRRRNREKKINFFPSSTWAIFYLTMFKNNILDLLYSPLLHIFFKF